MKKQSTYSFGQYIYMEWLIPIKDYCCSIRKNEAVFEILIPILISVICVYFYFREQKIKIALDGLSELLPTVISILIGFTIMFITLLLTSSGENIKQLQNVRTTKILYKKPLTLYQGLHIQFSHLLFSEIFLLLLIFFYLFLKGIGLSFVVSVMLLFGEIYFTLNILLSILRGITNLYFSFFNANEDKPV